MIPDSDSESEDELVMDTAPPPPPANQPPSRPTRIQADQAAYSALGESNQAKIVQNLIFKKYPGMIPNGCKYF